MTFFPSGLSSASMCNCHASLVNERDADNYHRGVQSRPLFFSTGEYSAAGLKIYPDLDLSGLTCVSQLREIQDVCSNVDVS